MPTRCGFSTDGWAFCIFRPTGILFRRSRWDVTTAGCSAAHHDSNDLVVGLLHALLAKTAHILEGVFYALGHNAVTGAELIAADVHIVAQQTGLHRSCDLCCAGGLGAIADDAGNHCQCIDDSMDDGIIVTAAEIGDTGTRTSARADGTAVGRQAANGGLFVDGGQVGEGQRPQKRFVAYAQPPGHRR